MKQHSLRRSKVLAPIGSPAQSGCVPVSRCATGAQPPTASRPASAESCRVVVVVVVVVVAHVCSLEQIKQEVRGQPAARRTEKRIRKGAALAYSASRIA